MIICAGVGPGHLDFMTRGVAHHIANADVVAGFDAVVEIIRPLIPVTAQIVTMNYRDQVAQLKRVAGEHHAGKRCVVVFMGDVHFSGFQYLQRVEQACGHPVDTWPGISSAQVVASRGKVCFDETTFITFHPRGDIEPFKQHLVHVLDDQRNAILTPRPWDFMPNYFFFNDTAPTEIYTLSLHDALPISISCPWPASIQLDRPTCNWRRCTPCRRSQTCVTNPASEIMKVTMTTRTSRAAETARWVARP